MDYEQASEYTKSKIRNVMVVHSVGGDHDGINTRDGTTDQDGGERYDVGDSTNNADTNDDAMERGDDATEKQGARLDDGIKGDGVMTQISELEL